MTRICLITGKKPLSGNKVSHANNKTKRRFLPNLQRVTINEESLGKIKLRLTTRALRTLDFYGGLENFLLQAKKKELNSKLLNLKKIIQRKRVNS